MRVIAGRYGGMALRAPRGDATRPTSDRVREALFSILGPAVAGARVLDLFAGSGALGIEALSRGAASAAFVDSAPAAVAAVQRNLHALGIGEEPGSGVDAGLDAGVDAGADAGVDAWVEVIRRPAIAFLRSAAVRGAQYDLVLVDPPYRLAAEVGPALSGTLAPVLAPDARVVTESDRRAPLELDLPLADERRYGDTLIRIHAAR